MEKELNSIHHFMISLVIVSVSHIADGLSWFIKQTEQINSDNFFLMVYFKIYLPSNFNFIKLGSDD